VRTSKKDLAINIPRRFAGDESQLEWFFAHGELVIGVGEKVSSFDSPLPSAPSSDATKDIYKKNCDLNVTSSQVIISTDSYEKVGIN